MIRKLLTASLTASVAFAVVFFASSATSNAQDVVILQGTIRKAKLNNKKRYLLQGVVFISKKLVIKAGAQIFGSQGSALVIQQGAKIKATGTQEEPIVMTSDQPVGDRRPGDWGGLVLNGRASINVPGGVGSGEGNTGNYGGGTSPDDNDSSGVLRFVRVEYGGFAISPENELNCIAFQGAGAGTEVDHIAAAWGGDDGIEFFGGTTNMKFAAIVGATDDSLDWTFGWRGKVQFLLVQQRAGEADNGIEADNNENNNNFTPRSAPRIMNATLVGPNGGAGSGAKRAMILRRGTGGELRNFIVTGWNSVALTIDGTATFEQVTAGTLQLRGMLFFNNGITADPAGSNFTGQTATAVGASGVKIMTGAGADPLLADPFDTTAPDFRPQAGSPALVADNAEPAFPDDPFFTTANYLGAFDQNTDWTAGWVNYVFGN